MKRLAVLIFFIATVAHAGASKDARQEFYRFKAQASSPEAYSRAVERLGRIHEGMSQNECLEALEMWVLARKHTPVDAWVEGLLYVEAGEDINAERTLVFGYVKDEAVIRTTLVIFRGNRISEIRKLGKSV